MDSASTATPIGPERLPWRDVALWLMTLCAAGASWYSTQLVQQVSEQQLTIDKLAISLASVDTKLATMEGKIAVMQRELRSVAALQDERTTLMRSDVRDIKEMLRVRR